VVEFGGVASGQWRYPASISPIYRASGALNSVAKDCILARAERRVKLLT
jgi:hypothetical protein